MRPSRGSHRHQVTQRKEEMKKKTDKKKIALIALIALIMLVIPSYAQTITMANPGGIAERDVLVYDANGTLWGVYNTTSTITLDANGSYIFALKPIASNPLEDPGDWLFGTVFPSVLTNVWPLAILVFLAALWLGRR